MNYQALLTHPTVQAVGWALVHFVWQGALLAVVLVLANALTRQSSARLRYAIACTVMLLMPAVFVATVLRSHYVPVSSPPPVNAAISDARPYEAAAGMTPGRAAIPAPPTNTWPSYTFTMIPGWIVCLWLGGVLGLSMYTAWAWRRVQSLRWRGTLAANPMWIDTMQHLMQRLRITRPVRLHMSACAEVPTVIGWIRPYILLPLSAVTGLDESQLRAVLAHELAHIRRYDYLVNLLQTSVETLLFYHPAVWWVGRRIRQERENCCDDLAVEVCGDVMVYAGALAQLEETRGGTPEPALAATGGDLLARIQRLTGQHGEKSLNRISGPVGAVLTAALALAATIGIGNVCPIQTIGNGLGAGCAPGRLAQSLGLDHLVLDQTGITTMFPIRLEYAPDETTPCNDPRCATDPTSDIPPGPSIFTALERLGLKLEPLKGPRGYVVIDSVDRPTEN